MARRTVASLWGFVFPLRRTLFGCIEEILEGAPDLQARPAVCEPEPEARGGESRRNSEEEHRVLETGENEQDTERRPEYAP